ncbi:MAG: phosphoribosylaminoimidazolesuccinocarboxamide synthase [Balneolaceae bacterium]|nr:MAG: phosphoribosylaminoimidazolesuccinocarboxamide synthase [Balneolaceae bacterium]
MHQKEAFERCITTTNAGGFGEPYKGKVRDVYNLNNKTIGIVVTDRISAFDYIMKQAIPYKGQILNKLSAFSFNIVKDILPTHVIDVPHPNVTIAKKCLPIPVEIVVRGYLTGHAWRVYKNGSRTLCGVRLPDGMKENQPFKEPILTPATKATSGHDEDISEEEILDRGLVSPENWQLIRKKAFELFDRGTNIAQKQGLILVDTKYEMGFYNNKLTLIDEVHTSDSSRYFYRQGFEQRLKEGLPQRQLSKEFLREWLMEKGFRGLEGQILPDLTDSFRWSIYQRYSELYEILTSTQFKPALIKDINKDLENIFPQYC